MTRVVRLCGAVAASAIVIMMAVTVIDVLSANLFNRPITGVYDLVQAALVITVFLGFPVTFLADRHITVDLIDLAVSPTLSRLLRRFAALVTAITLGFLAWYMVSPATDAFRYGERMQELGIPHWVLWIPMIVGIVLSALVQIRGVRAAGAPRDEAIRDSR